MQLVTIILTTLNSERYLARALESCLNQTYADLELLVVDGGSRDRTLEIVNSYHDPRLRVIHQKDNLGRLPGAINLGMAEARGAYLTWTQDDCWYEPHAIQTMAEYLDARPEVALVYTDYWDVDEHGAPIRYQRVNPPTREFLLVDDVIRQTFLFRREVYETIGPQETKWFPGHEVPWRMKVIARFRVEPLHVPLMYYGMTPYSLTGQRGGWRASRLMTWILFQEGHISAAEHRRLQAKLDIDQAYEAFILRGDYRIFWRCALKGLWRDPRWLVDRGLLKLLARSLLPGRARFRAGLLESWHAADRVSQHRLIAQAQTPVAALGHTGIQKTGPEAAS